MTRSVRTVPCVSAVPSSSSCHMLLPWGPGSPVLPSAPSAPSLPAGPGAPWGPGSPWGPGAPVLPSAPSVPSVPAGPWGPVGPCNPVGLPTPSPAALSISPTPSIAIDRGVISRPITFYASGSKSACCAVSAAAATRPERINARSNSPDNSVVATSSRGLLSGLVPTGTAKYSGCGQSRFPKSLSFPTTNSKIPFWIETGG